MYGFTTYETRQEFIIMDNAIVLEELQGGSVSWGVMRSDAVINMLSFNNFCSVQGWSRHNHSLHRIFPHVFYLHVPLSRWVLDSSEATQIALYLIPYRPFQIPHRMLNHHPPVSPLLERAFVCAGYRWTHLRFLRLTGTQPYDIPFWYDITGSKLLQDYPCDKPYIKHI